VWLQPTNHNADNSVNKFACFLRIHSLFGSVAAC
jgi:hypothetical protein